MVLGRSLEPLCAFVFLNIKEQYSKYKIKERLSIRYY